MSTHVPEIVTIVEYRLAELVHLLGQLDRQIRHRTRMLDGCTRYRSGLDVLRRELSERRQLRRHVVDAIEQHEHALARFRALTTGAPLGELVAAATTPTTQEGHD